MMSGRAGAEEDDSEFVEEVAGLRGDVRVLHSLGRLDLKMDQLVARASRETIAEVEVCGRPIQK
jgi:hypothetical protein